MGEIQTWRVEKPYLEIKGTLLEGPIYNATRNELRWIDIIDEQVYIHHVDTREVRKFDVTGNMISVTADTQTRDNILVVGAKHGFAAFDPDTGTQTVFRGYFDDNAATVKHRYRANDGAVDARGRIFQGIMIDEKVEGLSAQGKLLCLDTDGQLTRVVEDVMVPNGLGWNRDNSTMYWAESMSGNLYAFDYDLETGSAVNQRVFYHFQVDNNTNTPDGLVVDEEDHVWLANWGSSRVLRFAPDGKIVGQVLLPTRFVTCPVFMGSELVITTAVEREPDVFPESARFGGMVYKVDVGVRGLPKFEALHPSKYIGSKP